MRVISAGSGPGENAFDSKTPPGPHRARITLRNCLLKGWGHGAIGNGAALNLKESVDAVVDACVFVENDIAFRCRGAGSNRASAWLTARNCTIYETSRVFRLESGVENVKIFGLAIGEHVARDFDRAPGPGQGFEVVGSRLAPPLKAWPYVSLPVGDVDAGDKEKTGMRPQPTMNLATGWNGTPAGSNIPSHAESRLRKRGHPACILQRNECRRNADTPGRTP